MTVVRRIHNDLITHFNNILFIASLIYLLMLRTWSSMLISMLYLSYIFYSI